VATVYLNADTGDNSRTYVQAQSPTTPWLTIAKCNTSATDGDTIILQDSVATYLWTSITFTKGFIIQGQQDDASGAILDGASVAGTWDIPSNKTFSLSKLTIRNIVNPIYGPFWIIGGAPGIVNFESTNCIYKSIKFGSGSNISFLTDFNNAYNGTHTFNRCTFIDMERSGSGVGMFFLSGSGGTINHNLINCTFYWRSGLSSPVAVVTIKGSGTRIATIKNCIMKNDSGATIDVDSGSGGTFTYSYSDFHQMSSVPSGTGVITSDPLFVSVADNNFNLRPTSPCINTGVLI
jgi:hypothetical protein